MKVVGVIPARYKSSRFEGKPLALINKKPMIIHVAEQVEKAIGKDNTFVATDDQRIYDLVISSGYQCVMTPDNCKTGTDRIWEFAKIVNADIYLNVQGDEPMVSPEDILKIIVEKKVNMNLVVNGMLPMSTQEDPKDINIPKVLVNKHNDLIYMSRLPIPGIKDSNMKFKPTYLKQVCIYAFSYEELEIYGSNNTKSLFESFEDIEILRFMDFDIKIRMVMMETETIAVDNPGDIIKVENALKKLQ
ncbi:3-deoxy-manno-octulosonate cytidylyltransferase (CMP-KDO synthetase) [Nonlabens dokdonensis]|jgi:3-deoxy-manno-octulosonate cytidylyltransferase (CMP-KDO synthetase)|uniref:3-deoxy-manno-octulosonate cytidylyltransferase n=2 Tax=Nonlabens dokdonensis TaxID=328515 RepID=L7WEG3_NONDD|nr:3-deoxy-manno-octulosonate cytidylyltransferase [Nonlabens dokdonensis]AGC78672.1 3-deoxy-manno-octulosonate cytidylyltransferase [Nonlabens dokdonensis DSW-6]PZX39201.1 3-deoxy-manno-octulosonate cytidylyltransferase (CMP-KDO synthetase) [Nonlabens dokdonensis]